MSEKKPPLARIIIEFAKSAGYREPSSDLSFEELVIRAMKTHEGMDREDLEAQVCEEQREEIELFMERRFGQRRSG